MVALPKGVHRVVAGGREYLYWHPGRGTSAAGKRVALRSDPQTPEFWVELRKLQGLTSAPGAHVMTFGAVIDLYATSPQFPTKPSSVRSYKRQLDLAREMGNLPVDQVDVGVIRKIFDGMADKPPSANAFLGVMRTLSIWAVSRKHLTASITEGIEAYDVSDRGHKPWSAVQLQAAHDRFTGAVRRAFFLGYYTGQRISDVVRLGPTMIDENGFDISQVKTNVQAWCPILPELAAEMKTWKREPGPYVRKPDGSVHDEASLRYEYDKQREAIPELKDTTWHGLRASCVVRLRRAGLSALQISDVIGLSLPMVERYCRFANRKISGQAVLVALSSKGRKKA